MWGGRDGGLMRRTPSGREVVGLVAQDLERHRRVAHAVLLQDADRLVHRGARRRVVVEEVAAEQHHVAARLHRLLQHLLKRAEAVLPAHRVLLVHALQRGGMATLSPWGLRPV